MADRLLNKHKKSYRMQMVGPNGETIRTSVPKKVIEKEAANRGLSVSDFIDQYKINWLEDGFSGIHGAFIRK